MKFYEFIIQVLAVGLAVIGLFFYALTQCVLRVFGR